MNNIKNNSVAKNIASNTFPKNATKKVNHGIKKFFGHQDAVYEITNHKQSFGLFTKLFHIRKFYLRILIAIFVGLILAFNSLFFIQSTGLYTAGLTGIFQGFARIALAEIEDPNLANTIFFLIFYGGYFIANIPLAIFGYYKIGKKFSILSLVTLIVANLIPILINLIPEANNWLTNDFQIFGDIKPTEDSPDILLFQNNFDILKLPSFILYGIVAGAIAGISYAIILIISGSTGGIDFISFYYSIKKNKSIGIVVFYFNLISVIISVIIGSFIPAGLQSGFNFNIFFSQNLVVSLAMIIVTFWTYNSLFPKEKIISTKIYGHEILDIVNFLNSKNFTHSMTINKSFGGYSGKDNYNLEIVCQYLELPQLLSDIRKVSSDALVIITIVKGIDGRMQFENSIRY